METYSKTQFISVPAFTLDTEPSFFLPLQIDGANLADSLKVESIDAALGPFEEALRQLIAAKPAFDKIIVAIKPAAGVGSRAEAVAGSGAEAYCQRADGGHCASALPAQNTQDRCVVGRSTSQGRRLSADL